MDYLSNVVVSGINLYSYCGNDPVNYYDPSGNGAILIGLIAGAVIGLTSGLLYATCKDYFDDYSINISIGWQEYIKDSIYGSLIGGIVGAIIGYSLPILSSFASSSITIGGGLSLSSSGAATLSTGISITGTQVLKGIGTLAGIGALGASVMFSKGADRYKPKDSRSNYVQNEEFKRICDEYGLNDTQRDRIHHKITKKGYNVQQIRELIERLYPYLRRW